MNIIIVIVSETKKQLFPSQATEISLATEKIENNSQKKKPKDHTCIPTSKLSSFFRTVTSLREPFFINFLGGTPDSTQLLNPGQSH